MIPHRLQLRSHARHPEAGVTLLEVLIVLAIVVMLAAVAGPRVVRYFGEAKADTAKVQIEALSSALELYYLDVGRYPTEAEGLQALASAPAGAERWNGPYIRKSGGLVDPWGRAYRYRSPGEHGAFDVYSFGRDDAEAGSGEDADATSW